MKTEDADPHKALTNSGSPPIPEAEPDMPELIQQAAASLGFTGEKIFEKLLSGQSLGVAAGIPADAVQFLYGRAHSWVKAGQFQHAEKLFQSVCIADPAMADSWAGLGFCLAQRSAWAEAEAAFSQAVTLRPDWGAMHVYRLETLVHLENWPAAEKQMEHIKAMATGTPPDLLLRAEYYEKLIIRRLETGKQEERQP